MDEHLETFRECRDWRHHWQPWRAWKIAGGWEEHRRCENCGSIVVRILDKNGFQISRHIKSYAEGYIHKGQGRLTDEDKAELRLAGIRQAAKRSQPK